MHTNTGKVVKIMEGLAPDHLAESWDNVGLLIGHKNKMIQNILLALDVTEVVIDEAIEKNVDMIITHHPLIFKGLKTLTEDNTIAKMAMKLIRNDINLYAAHTNLDVCDDNTSMYLADLLSIKNTSILEVWETEKMIKIQVFVPESHLDQVKEAMFTHGAGQIETYDQCAYQTKGRGQFRPLEGASPYIGDQGQVAYVEEVKVEVLAPKTKLQDIISHMIKAHPYEVPAFDIIETLQKGHQRGVGSVGVLDKPMTLKDLSRLVKDTLKVEGLRFCGDPDKMIRRVAITTGSGMDFMKSASKKADVLITGDIKYHEAQEALQRNLCLIDAGHYETEVIFMDRLKVILDEHFEEKSYDIQVMVSQRDINPFKCL